MKTLSRVNIVALSLILTVTLIGCGPSASIGTSRYSYSNETEFRNRHDAVMAAKRFFSQYQSQETGFLDNKLKSYDVTNEYFRYTVIEPHSSIKGGDLEANVKIYYDDIKEIKFAGQLAFPNRSCIFFVLKIGDTIGGLCVSGYFNLAKQFGKAIVYLRDVAE